MKANKPYPDPNPKWTVIIGIIGAILTFVIIVNLQTLFYTVEKSELNRKVINQAPEELSQLKALQIQNINTYRWIDPQNKIAAIPIEEAIRLHVKDPLAPLVSAPAVQPSATP